ncbi:MAG: AAA family ATPase [Balneolaceae bacterium]|nr:AAA family ATPase [Balneolaceae bacterium]
MSKTTKQYLFSELKHFLNQKESYPHQVDEIEHIQTHISHLFLAGSFVYKIKKPVDFGFLDYSTLQKRRKYCQREIELNRRLSDDIYLGVIGIARDNGKYHFEPDNPDSDAIIEYAVKMRKLPEEYFLDQIVKEGNLENEHLNRVADILTAFYQEQNNKQDLLKWGKIETIQQNTDENFEQTEKFIGQTISRNSYDAIRYFTDHYYHQNEELFRRRMENGLIVDGHGDLHLEHIHITPQKVQIYDCIEFNERFRYGDLAADLAFLAMDLDFNNCSRQERYFVQLMSEKLEDEELLKIIDFYKCYRAYVKGKVKSLQSVEEEVPKENRKQLSERADRYFNLSLNYTLVGSQPVVVVFMGRIATGKSTLAKRLSEQINIECYSSDRVRKSQAGLEIDKRTPSQKRRSLYSADMSEKTYNILISNAIESVKNGNSVILDATFSRKKYRKIFVDRLMREEISYLFIEVCADDSTIIERLKARENKEEIISDARLEDFDTLTAGYEKPLEIDQDHIISIQTAQPGEDTIEQLYRKMIDNHLKR